MYDRIALEIQAAALEDAKIAMFHFQVLMNAELLSAEDPADFCRMVGVPVSYATEFRKMLSLAQMMKRHRITLTRN